ncbi:hypothetical protein L208DRAFT_1378981 [Tricholoma matsutake]|nr:hypothetical protein L208DRAFT_1378981 [Tricholoma matsutake 945]
MWGPWLLSACASTGSSIRDTIRKRVEQKGKAVKLDEELNTTSVPVKSKEEIEAWIVEFGRKNEADLRAAGVPFVDFRSETSNTHLSVTFECTPFLRGRITPFPHYHDLYVLDFVSTTDGKRFDRDTNLDIYDVGVLGEEEPINTQGTVPERRGTVDIYTLNPGRTVQICRRNDKQVLKTVSFAYSGGKIMPRIE